MCTRSRVRFWNGWQSLEGANPGFLPILDSFENPQKADLIDHSLEFWLYYFKVEKSKAFVLQNL